ncbi:glycosyltransferase family A protein [uncultured Bacteroides sp.]|uniref:glycosyltransferase family 2 protein n=1 Tax=uncultured Bacteroides sp. TaxID=162156 RepID=UPI0025E31500|nr:glycosyltransferase family A protein [uncultured Bacteroides sp.]
MISIIMPIYNAEKYLSRSIESIICQTCHDWELILVDDGSTDESAHICVKYVEKDSRITLLSKLNGGVSSARNMGIDAVCGEWMTFMDADDWLEKEAIETYVDDLNKHKADIYNYCYFFNYDDARVDYIKAKRQGIVNFEKEEIYFDIIRRLVHVWDNLYSKAIIQKYNLRFNIETKLGEDILFNLNYLTHCHILYLSDKGFYQYYWAQNPQSLTWAKQSPWERVEYAKEIFRLHKLLSRNGRVSDEVQSCYKNNVMIVLRIAIEQNISLQDILKMCRQLVDDNLYKQRLWFTKNHLFFYLFYAVYWLRLRIKK